MPHVTDDALKQYDKQPERGEPYQGHRISGLRDPRPEDFIDSCLPKEGYHKEGCPERKEP
jgi:hypothetical protein